jgi:hypothetical protein
MDVWIISTSAKRCLENLRVSPSDSPHKQERVPKTPAVADSRVSVITSEDLIVSIRGIRGFRILNGE